MTTSGRRVEGQNTSSNPSRRLCVIPFHRFTAFDRRTPMYTAVAAVTICATIINLAYLSSPASSYRCQLLGPPTPPSIFQSVRLWAFACLQWRVSYYQSREWLPRYNARYHTGSSSRYLRLIYAYSWRCSSYSKPINLLLVDAMLQTSPAMRWRARD